MRRRRLVLDACTALGSKSCSVCIGLRMRSSKTCVYVTVLRRCLVCDREDEVEERENAEPIGAPCSSCSAPTERVEIRARRTRPVEVNPHAAALGRLGGLKGGPARAAKLSPQRRREIALRAIRKRWGYED
jgi:hypothetical protein